MGFSDDQPASDTPGTSLGARLGYASAAAYLGVTVGTLRSMVHRGTVPHLRYGPRQVRFDRRDLDRWLDERRVAAGVP
jgi:excisionase family DNA binding protein